jgi:hypothetical protein
MADCEGAGMAKTKPAWTNDPYQLSWRVAAFKGSPRAPMPLRERFESKLRPGPGDCWAWGGAHFKQTGYCCFSIKRADGKWRPTVAHRVAYELYIAEIPPGLVIDHLCRNRSCVNPWHMEPVTFAENVRRGWLANQGGLPNWASMPDWDGRCKHGHFITPETTVIRKNGKQECRTCVHTRDNARNANGGRREHYAAMHRKRKAAAASR